MSATAGRTLRMKGSWMHSQFDWTVLVTASAVLFFGITGPLAHKVEKLHF
jgi:hypothetical protein